MDEEISIISSNNRNEKIKKFFLENKNKLVSLILIIILCLSGFFGYEEFNKRQRISISNEFNSVIMNFSDKNKKITIMGGSQTRPNIHINDMIGVYEHILTNDVGQGIYNAGFENISILDIANMVIDKVDAEIVITSSNDPRSYRQSIR